MKRVEDIDHVRLAANLLVVGIHAFAAFQYCERGTVEFKGMQFVCNGVCSVAMPALFFISGYLLFRGLSFKTWPHKIWSRFKRLVVPYVAWNMLFVAFYLSLAAVVPRLSERVEMFGLDSISGAVDKVLSPMVAPIDMPLWYLRTVFVFSLFAPFLLFAWMGAGRSRFLRCVFGLLPYVGIGVVYCLSVFGGIGDKLEFTYPAYAMLAFTIGGHIAQKGIDPVCVLTRWWLWPVAVAGMIGLGLLFVDHWWKYTGWRDLFFVAATPLLFLCLPLLRKLFVDSLFVRFLREGSFFLFGGHFLFCSIVLHSVARNFPDCTGKFVVLACLFCFVGGTLTMAIYAGVRKIVPRISAPFTGTL